MQRKQSGDPGVDKDAVETSPLTVFLFIIGLVAFTSLIVFMYRGLKDRENEFRQHQAESTQQVEAE